tara:strand:+ start:123 stop:470 length:348 start_codon:yes stop_codon:yes gene_type:complete
MDRQMMDDDAWKSYTDERIEQLERELEFKRRIRYLRTQGFSNARIRKFINELGFSITPGKVYALNRDIKLQPGQGNGGRTWSDETRRRREEAKAERARRIAERTRWYLSRCEDES